jgi:hypothetical protein
MVGPTEVSIASLTPSGALGNYVNAGQVRVQVSCSAKSGSFVASGDLLQIVYK